MRRDSTPPARGSAAVSSRPRAAGANACASGWRCRRRDTAALAPALARFARSDEADATSVRATAVEGDGAIVFVFSGNGSQWSGMGRAAYQANAAFRDALAEIDSHFLPLAGWSLVEELDSADIATDLARTDVAQPLIFAIQAASVRALARVGVRPALTVGHSVGEVAAAEAAGVLSLSDAIRVIFHRSRLQQATENAGGMAVVFGPRESAAELVSRIPGLSIAAHNSHRCVAVAGPQHALDRLMTVAPGAKLRARRLDLPYPFHTELMQPVKKPLIEALATLKPSTGSVPFLSTVAGELVQGPAAGAAYWWRNVRQVVQFQEGVERALGAGKRVFLEIGPRPTLKTHLRDAAEHLNAAALVDCVLDESAAESGDPFEAAAMRLIAGGADVGQQWAFGPDPGPGVALPAYPWRRAPYRFPETTEATGQLSARPRHPLTGAREADGSLEWRAIVDPQAEPALADHRVDGQTLLPGAAFLEMGLAVARDWAGPDVALRDFEIQQPLAFSADVSREILSRIEASTATVEILSRPRLAKAPFTLHARGRIVQKPGPAPELGSASAASSGAVTGEEVYARARTRGLDFGPAFQGLAQAASRERRPHRGPTDRRCGRPSLRPRPGPPRFLFSRAYPSVRRTRRRRRRLSAGPLRRSAPFSAECGHRKRQNPVEAVRRSNPGRRLRSLRPAGAAGGENPRRALPGGPTARVGQAFRSRPRPALDRRRPRPRGRPASRSPADPR